MLHHFLQPTEASRRKRHSQHSTPPQLLIPMFKRERVVPDKFSHVKPRVPSHVVRKPRVMPSSTMPRSRDYPRHTVGIGFAKSLRRSVVPLSNRKVPTFRPTTVGKAPSRIPVRSFQPVQEITQLPFHDEPSDDAKEQKEDGSSSSRATYSPVAPSPMLHHSCIPVITTNSSPIRVEPKVEQLRQNLEAWLHANNLTVQQFKRMHCFGLLEDSPPTEVASIAEERPNAEDVEVEHFITALKSLLEKGFPQADGVLWLKHWALEHPHFRNVDRFQKFEKTLDESQIHGLVSELDGLSLGKENASPQAAASCSLGNSELYKTPAATPQLGLVKKVVSIRRKAFSSAKKKRDELPFTLMEVRRSMRPRTPFQKTQDDWETDSVPEVDQHLIQKNKFIVD
ncbi:unnamed protein product [Cyprideis torosa]|uniref:Uncharacterized protein n=1 Tax=Cyprideis torosa TaxID=163714 RepID=A0A7R8WPN6_9CRUS|nr:unnamed protein product [Cyprideis torosa]CAG0901753.1 unnamed protein product [Cyprideis torosa]